MKTVTRTQAKYATKKCMQSKLVPLLLGSPGVSKSALYQEVAKELNLFFIDVRPSSLMVEDVNGFPRINDDTNKSEYVPFDMFPVVGDKIPDGYKGFLIALDELPQATKEMQSSLFKIILDRKVGNLDLHPMAFVVAAGNRAEDNAFVNPLSTALKSRLIHFELDLHVDEWTSYANNVGIDERIIAFVNYNHKALNNFNPDSEEKTFSCPRTWKFLSDLIKTEKDLHNISYLIAGCVGVDITFEFTSFCDVYKDLPSIKDIINDPTQSLPIEPQKKYAVIQHIISQLDLDKFKDIFVYIDRFTLEFKIVLAKGIKNKHPIAFYNNNDVVDFLINIIPKELKNE